jgi:hypothetical protein
MKTIEFVPSVCKEREEEDEHGKPVLVKGKPVIVKPTFQGSITLKMPDFFERQEVLKEAGLSVNEKGEVSIDRSNLLSNSIKLVKMSQKFYQKVNLKKIDGGQEYKSFEDLSMDPDCDEIISEVSSMMRAGFRPGKN